MTNPYCESLTALRNAPSHYLKEVGDQWRTPDPLFWGINAMFGPLMLDLFADDSNAKCPVWYTAEDNALTQNWSEMLSSIGGAAFGNPPYSRSQYHEKQAITGMTHIMNYAAVQREKGAAMSSSSNPQRAKPGGQKMRIMSALSAGELGSICLSGLTLPTTNKGQPARFLRVPLLCLIRPGEEKNSVISTVPNWKQKARHLWRWRSLPLIRR